MVIGNQSRCGVLRALGLALALTLAATPLVADPASPAGFAAQVRQLLDEGDLATLLAAVDSAALARDAGLDDNAAAIIRRMQQQLASQRFHTARVYQHADQVHVRLDLSPEGLGWLTLTGEAGERLVLRGWQDNALGASLAELVASMAKRAEDRRGRRFLDQLATDPLAAWRSLSAAQQDSAAARLLLMSCASAGCYDAALARLDALEGDTTPALWQLDAAALARDWRRFDRVHTALQSRLGEDPALVMLGAQAALARDNCPDALARATPAQQRWPDYPGLYPVLAECRVRTGEYEAALSVFDEMYTRFGTQIDWSAMAEHPVYAALVASDAYRRWRADTSH